ncbi:molybdate ABC transporter substrate-binding protein [Capillimicrobium parvum]|uniref:Molybdate-binding protein ModA n=1 Tax=Capillimicrobium parvum TaxID=2884022 RepID=A0A9E6XZS5_9ACTN|nr:molybdate ABC transporter substrate-binding protein [Capillimicrobium parvum]UGS36786.1 Molybdate-binding protein ModA [Capillimicrobium parvum]
MTRRTKMLCAALATGTAVVAFAAPAQALTVYAASSLRDAVPEIQRNATFNFAGSNTLQAQIERGAPADVFASASPQEAQALFREGRCSRPVTFATNTLVLLISKGNPGKVRSVYTLREGGRRLAVGTPGVPIGDYTRNLLARMRLSSILSSNTVSQETNVANITAKVALGSADAGFAYITDGRSAKDRVSILTLPRWAQPPVRYQMCVVQRDGADSAGAHRFIGQARSNRGRAVLRSAGFGVPPRG